MDVFTFFVLRNIRRYAETKNVTASKRKIIEPDHPLPKLLIKAGTFMSAINPKNIEAMGRVA